MKMFKANAERLLYEKAKTIHDTRNSWRCVYINFAANLGQAEYSSHQSRMDLVTNIIQEILKDDDGHIYLCQDGDVFILFQGLFKPILDRLNNFFSGLNTDVHENFYTVFDFSKDWGFFLPLCKAKTALVSAPPHATDATSAVKPAICDFAKIDATFYKSAVAQRAKRKRPLVLVVEDDSFTRRLVRITLKLDCDIVEADSGQSALHAYATHAPDAVFLDIELPDLNGKIVLKKLLEFDKQAFVVMLSAHSLHQNIVTSLEDGAQGFISKPFARDKLVHYLRMCSSATYGMHIPPRLTTT